MAIPTKFLLPRKAFRQENLTYSRILRYVCSLVFLFVFGWDGGVYFPTSNRVFICRGIQRNILKVADFEDIVLDLLILSAVRTGL